MFCNFVMIISLMRLIPYYSVVIIAAAIGLSTAVAMGIPNQEFHKEEGQCATQVGDVVSVSPPGTIRLLKSMLMEVRALGMGITECSEVKNGRKIIAESRISINGADYSQLFYGTQHDIDPSQLLHSMKYPKGTAIDFGGRYVKRGIWAPFFTTRNNNAQVIALASGDVIPTSFDLANSGKISSYLKRVLDVSGKVKIGPMSLLILAEYAATDHSKECFDYQDMVLLVTFSDVDEDAGPK